MSRFLEKPIRFRHLIDKGCKFTIEKFPSIAFDDPYEDLDGVYTLRTKKETNSSIQKLLSPWLQPFDQLRQQMVKLNPYMYKRVNKQGNTDQPTVPLNARVHIRYSAFWEGESAPFDSTDLREEAYSFVTGTHCVLEGLEAAVRTMHIGEEADFIISYHLLFHEIGCPPRIKPKADGLFVIELLKYEEVGDIYEDLQIEENCCTFAAAVEKVRNIRLKGLDDFRCGSIRNAVQAFWKAEHLLRVCDIADDGEEAVQKELLIALYTNMAICYNRLGEPKSVCKVCKQLRLLTDKPPCKALFHEGRALSILGEYRQSRQLLVQAQRLEPNNESINTELRILENRYRRYKESEKSICRKAFGFSKSNDNHQEINGEKRKPELNSFIENELLELFNDFKLNEKQNSLVIPAGLTADEISQLKKISEKLDFKMSINPANNNTYIIEKRIRGQ